MYTTTANNGDSTSLAVDAAASPNSSFVAAGSRSSVADLRRERDITRGEMERVVRQMQGIEADLDAKRPGAEERRQELSRCRLQLGELRRRMRAIMEASSGAPGSDSVPLSQAASFVGGLSAAGGSFHGSSNSAGAVHGSSPRGGAVGGPSSYARQPSTSQSSWVDSRAPPDGNASPPPLAPISSSTPAGEEATLALRRRHEREEQALEAEYQRLRTQMQRRHGDEAQQLGARLDAEARHTKEFEEARQRMERARTELELLQRQRQEESSMIANVPPEVSALSRMAAA